MGMRIICHMCHGTLQSCMHCGHGADETGCLGGTAQHDCPGRRNNAQHDCACGHSTCSTVLQRRVHSALVVGQVKRGRALSHHVLLDHMVPRPQCSTRRSCMIVCDPREGMRRTALFHAVHDALAVATGTLGSIVHVVPSGGFLFF
jgi:hypothetical protein